MAEFELVIKAKLRAYTIDGQALSGSESPELTDELTEALESEISDTIDNTDIELEDPDNVSFAIMITDVEVTPGE